MVEAVQPSLGEQGDLNDVAGLAGAAVGERGPDARSR
jgi:hypothetical protein